MIKFDEYGQPHISPEEEQNCGCLLKPTRRGTDCPIASADREIQLLLEPMEELFGICVACWEPLAMYPRHNPRNLPLTPCLGWTEIRTRRGELTTGKYAAPTRAVKSLETLWKAQIERKLSDTEYYRLRYNGEFYLDWEQSTSTKTISLYPWRYVLEK